MEFFIHVEQNKNLWRALYFPSDEFDAALNLLYLKGQDNRGLRALKKFFNSIANWCFDGSIDKMDWFSQEEGLTEPDLPWVPNLDGKNSIESRAEEHVQVFRLAQQRLFARTTERQAVDE